jgi:DNA-binding NarL/FixJ family response regulator
VAERLAQEAMPHADGPPHTTLSDREYEVFRMLVNGRTVTEIAASLHLSGKTVSTHKARLMEKLGIENNADLVHYAVRHRLADDLSAK